MALPIIHVHQAEYASDARTTRTSISRICAICTDRNYTGQSTALRGKEHRSPEEVTKALRFSRILTLVFLFPLLPILFFRFFVFVFYFFLLFRRFSFLLVGDGHAAAPTGAVNITWGARGESNTIIFTGA